MTAPQQPETTPAVNATPTAGTCPSCQEPNQGGAVFCEACGVRLSTPPTVAAQAGGPARPAVGCPVCGPTVDVDPDGYCSTCGRLVARDRDHVEHDVSDAGVPAAAVTDRGLRHHRNEDAVSIAAVPAGGRGRPVVNIVVADGVSSSFDPDVASATAVEVAGHVLAAETDEWGEVLVRKAILAAADAVVGLAHTGDPRRAASAPSCTIVATTIRDGDVTCGWIGDSRAYWVPDTGPAVQLTVDDSWASDAIRAGIDEQTALNDRRAHIITRWLGADADPAGPQVTTLPVDTPGLVVVCSDGLWNYLPDRQTFADTVRATAQATADESSPMLALTRTLTRFAVDAGGADNITVAAVAVTPDGSNQQDQPTAPDPPPGPVAPVNQTTP